MSTVEYGIDSISNELGANAQDYAPAGDIDHIRPLPRISVQAFCESDAVARVVEQIGQDRRMAKVSFRSNSGTISAAATMFASMPTPNLLIIETTTAPQNMMKALEPLAEVCDPSTKVVVIGHHNDIGLYRDLMRAGISEYLVAPVGMAEILNAITSIFVDPDAEPLGRTIAFIGAKGGVGSSTIAHNCAFGISSLFETETILADLDLPYGTANIDFNQDPAQGMAEAIYSPDRLDEVFLDRLLAKCSDHLSLLAAPSLLDRAFDLGNDAFTHVLDTLIRAAPVTVLDVPHTWNDWTRSVLASADEVVITATLDLANLRNTKNLYDALRKLRPNDKLPHLVLNQAGMPKRPEISPDDFCEPLDIEPMAIIPFDVQLFGNAANTGRMIAEIDSKSPITETFAQLSHVLTGRATMKKPRKSGIEKVLGVLGRK